MLLFLKILLGIILLTLFIAIISKLFVVEKKIYYDENEVKDFLNAKDEEIAFWKQAFYSMKKEKDELLKQTKLF